MRIFITAIGILRAPLLVAALAACVLTLPGQSREVFQAIRETSGTHFYLELVRAAALTVVFSAALLGSALLLIASRPPSRTEAIDRYGRWLEALAIGLALVPPSAVGLAAIDTNALRSMGPDWLHLDKVIVGAALTLSISIVAAIGISRVVGDAIIGRVKYVYRPIGLLSAVQGLVLVGVLIAALNFSIVMDPTKIANLLGPVGIILLFATTLCMAASLLTYLYDRYQFPALTALALAAVAWAVAGWSNNHHVRMTDAPEVIPPVASAAFIDWLRQRDDLGAFAGRPYTVYVVAAEGGGLYAAAHAAWTLARIQDACPAFARHVFAISAVSGGSLGAAVFSALVKAQDSPRETPEARKCAPVPVADGAMERAVRSYFREDLLTPLLAAGLFPDFTQRFLPTPIPQFDRARALEASYEQTWSRVAGSLGRTDGTALFGESVRRMWSAHDVVPALLLNTTAVRTGDRTVIAPFRLGHELYFREPGVDALNGAMAVRLSTAVGLSARFPIVTPPALLGTVWNGEQFIDGGVYENSGIQTAMDIAEMIRSLSVDARWPTSPTPPEPPTNDKQCAQSNTVPVDTGTAGVVSVCLKFIAIRYSTLIRPPQPLADEIVAPIVGLYEARNARGRTNNLMARRIYCGGKYCGEGRRAEFPHIYVKYIGAQGLPLGWYLSSYSLERALSTTGRTVDCHSPAEPEPGSTALQMVEDENYCLLQRIARDLN